MFYDSLVTAHDNKLGCMHSILSGNRDLLFRYHRARPGRNVRLASLFAPAFSAHVATRGDGEIALVKRGRRSGNTGKGNSRCIAGVDSRCA